MGERGGKEIITNGQDRYEREGREKGKGKSYEKSRG